MDYIHRIFIVWIGHFISRIYAYRALKPMSDVVKQVDKVPLPV